MKKQLLIGSALLAAISAFPQSKRMSVENTNVGTKISGKYALEPTTTATQKIKSAIGPVQNSAQTQQSSVSLPPSTINWNLVTGSMNVNGMLVSQTRPLQYNKELNAVTFVHRKSDSYVASPTPPSGALSGVIVAEITSNWGATWDSTCIWADAVNWGRYPQGAIYNPTGNTNIANAYFVGSGPAVAGNNFTGNWYASKKLDVFNNTPDATANAQQFIPFAPTATNVASHGWSRMGFSATDDGAMRSLALIQGDNTTLGDAALMRGAAVVKGSYNAGVFTWITDSIIPSTVVTSAGVKEVFSAPQMVWNQAGNIGYVVFIGASASGTGSNKGWQPIVWKTTNSGTSWSAIQGIDFNSPAMAPVLKPLDPIWNSTVAAQTPTVPFFNVGEGYDCVVDSSGRLHIASTIISHTSNHFDSLTSSNYIYTDENYLYPHEPGRRAYLYDFISDGATPWTYKLIDSIATEGPSSQPAGNGFAENQWDPTGTGGAKVESDARIQLARTPDGKYITFSWSESDPAFTNGAKNWNNLPNIKTRCMATGPTLNDYYLSNTEINATKVATGTGTNNPNVSSRATLHYMSPTTSAATVVPGPSGFKLVDMRTPLSVTNSNPYGQTTNNTTWIQCGVLSYDFNLLGVGVKENLQTSAGNSFIYPNPATESTLLNIDLKNNSAVNIIVMNAVGQVVKNTTANGQMGANTINVDLTGLSAGIYMVNVNADNTSSTKKLIVK